eukprot:6180068-Pleurochrysis_carterae.AAC.1
MSSLCSTSFPTNLPKEFRQWNRHALEQATQRRASVETGGLSSGPHGDATLSTTTHSETRRAE